VTTELDGYHGDTSATFVIGDAAPHARALVELARAHVSHVGRPQTGHRLRVGMAFTVEPMINAGTSATRTDADGWTVRTVDGALSAQFEHTLLIGPHGPEIMTLLA
ncbi:MAG: type I methionyl aminopeptidase, partial [Deltaproteobacteria bacterium]|nr:type I methionyl aminopeptidase [Deltaproteobacteria bacterium]